MMIGNAFKFCLVLFFLGTSQCLAQQNTDESNAKPTRELRILSFNILQAGGDAANVGFSNKRFGGSRYDELAAVIRLSKADIVGVQEDDRSGKLLKELGKEWTHKGTIYSRFPIKAIQTGDYLTVCRVNFPLGKSIVVVNCHWSASPYGPYLIQDHLRKHGSPADLAKFEKQILKGCEKNDAVRGYDNTVGVIANLLEAEETVLLTGDFNEPSHKDWSARAAKKGMDRWFKNPTGIPLRFSFRWEGSRSITNLGFTDAYRKAFPDEVKHPGITWTPHYPAKTKGRRPFGDQVLDRIDMIYFAGADLKLQSAAVVGESKETSEIVFKGDWPTDHRAVLAVFELAK